MFYDKFGTVFSASTYIFLSIICFSYGISMWVDMQSLNKDFFSSTGLINDFEEYNEVNLNGAHFMPVFELRNIDNTKPQ